MSVSIGSSSEFLSALREYPEWKDEVRREVLSEDLLRLPARMQQVELELLAEQRRGWRGDRPR